MILNSKVMGLILAAILSMGGLSASAAEAEVDAQLTTTGTKIDGTQLPGAVFSRLGRTFTCKTGTTNGAATNGATTLTLTPSFSECESPSIKGPATVKMNGCNFVFHLTADASDTFTAVRDLSCPAGVKAEILFYSNHTNHTAGTTLCQFTFGSQAGLTTIDLTNEPAAEGKPDYVLAHLNVTGISSTSHKNPLVCGAHENATGSLTGTMELRGTNAGGELVGATVSTD